jgi:hypothetical protein
MITKQQYVEYLICTIGNYTSSHLAEHLDEVSQDVVTDYLRSEHLTARGIWGLVAGLIQDSPEAFMLVDDSVQDKRYSQFIELVKLQYSGAEHGLVRGIGIVNLVHSAGTQKDFYPIDYRRTNTFLKWSSMLCTPRNSRRNASCLIAGMPLPRT